MTTTVEKSRTIKGIEAMSEQQAGEMAEDLLEIKATLCKALCIRTKQAE